jgi:hypothetical protein
VNRAAGTGGLDESPDDDDDVVDMDELLESGNGHHDDNDAGNDAGNGAGNGTHGSAGWNGGERPSEHRSPGDGNAFGRVTDVDSSDAS